MTTEGAPNRKHRATVEDGFEPGPQEDPRAGAPVHHAALAAGSTFARYEIVRCIGVGGMGAVFEATHSLLKKRVALKTLHANLSRSESGRDRFLREAETVARIRHPNVVDITDVGVEGGVPFFVMEFLEGEDVASLLERGTLEPEIAADIVVPIVSGLSAVHRLGIVHRDIKPENIFLSRDNHGEVVPKLVDFGVSKDIAASMGAGAPPLHTVTGTPHYMSPEQARGSATLDGRADQYALGVLLYQCLSGLRPYEAASLLELMHLIDLGEFRPLRSLVPAIPPELEQIIHRAMSRHPRDRFESCDAFGSALVPYSSARTRFTHERDFQGKAILQSSLSQKDAALHARLAANTLPVEAFAGPATDVPAQTSSGVRVRHELGQGPSEAAQAGEVGLAAVTFVEPRKGRGAWVVVAGALLLAAVFCAWFMWPKPAAAPPPAVATPVTPAKEVIPPSQAASAGPVAPTVPAQVAPPRAPEPASVEVPKVPEASARRRRSRATPKTELAAPQNAPKPAPLDIQLSR